jgi:hypothetical protein
MHHIDIGSYWCQQGLPSIIADPCLLVKLPENWQLENLCHIRVRTFETVVLAQSA